MPSEKGTPLSALKQWKTISDVEGSVVDKIKYFYGFQTYLAEDNVRKPSAIFVTTDDEVYAVGYNASDNLLALEDDDFAKTINLTEPRKINGLSGKKIKKLTVSERFGAALTEDGQFLYWGMQMEMLQHEERSKNYLEPPGFPRQDLEVAAYSCGGHSITFLTKNGEVLIWGCLNLQYSAFYEFERIAAPDDAAIVGVTSGWYHVALLDDQGRVWTFGIGQVGELGYYWTNNGSLSGLDYITPRQVQLPRKCLKVECGSNSTIFLLENGDVYACGNNLQLDYLCVGKKTHVFDPLRVFLNDPIADIMAAYNWSGKQWQSRFTAMSKKGEYFKWGEEKGQKVPSKVTGVNSLAEIYVNFITPQGYGDVTRTERDVQAPEDAKVSTETKLPPPKAKEPGIMSSTDMPKVPVGDPDIGRPTNAQKHEDSKPVKLPTHMVPKETSPAKPGIPSPGKPGNPSPAKPGTPIPAKPGTSSPVKPATSSPVKPGIPSPAKPGIPSPAKPGVSNPTKPGTPSPAKPGAPSPAKPGAPSPAKPGVSNPTKPGTPSPAKPGAPSPAKPGAPSPAKPGAPSPAKPGAPNPAKPGIPSAVSPHKKPKPVSPNRVAVDSAKKPPVTTAASSSEPKQPIAVNVKGQNEDMNQPEKTRSNPFKWPIFKSVQKHLASEIAKFLVFSGYDTSRRQEGFGAFLITRNDDVLSFGINTEEKLLGLAGSIGEEYLVEIPTKIENLSGKNIKKIVVGLFQGAALSTTGSVYMWNQQSGPALMEMKGKNYIDVASGSKFILTLTSDSAVYLTGELSFEYEEKNKKISIPNGVKIKSVECGEWHGGFVSTDGEAYTFGHGVYDQLGYQQEPEDDAYEAKKVPFDQPCVKIACGVRSTSFLLKNGEVYTCGSNTATDRVAAHQEESSAIPEQMEFPELIVDLVAVIRNANYGARVDVFAAKSATGKIYKWSGRNPATIDDAETLLRAFEGLAIPQSMSMVDYEFQEGDLQEKSPVKDPSLVSNESTEAGEKTQTEDGGLEDKKENKVKVMAEESKSSAEDNDENNTPDPGLSYGRPDHDSTVGSSGRNEMSGEYGTDQEEASGEEKSPSEKDSNNLFGDSRYSDLTIKLSNGTIQAHKVLLYTKSSFFRHAMARNDIEELDLSTYNPKSVTALLKHIYEVPIGEQVSMEDAADFQGMAEKDGGSSVLQEAKLLLYSSVLYDVVTTHLNQKPASFKTKVLKAILPSKRFP